MTDLRTLRGRPVNAGRAGGPTPHPFVVDSAMDDTAVLRPLTTVGKTFAGSLTVGEQLTIGSPTRNGFACADVVVQRWTAANRMLLVSNPRSMEPVQRRTFKRVPMSFDVEVSVERDGWLLTRPGVGIDLSLGGFAVSLEGDALRPGEHVGILLRLSAGRLLTVAEIVAVSDLERNARVTRGSFTQLLGSDQPTLAISLHEAELARVRVAGEHD